VERLHTALERVDRGQRSHLRLHGLIDQLQGGSTPQPHHEFDDLRGQLVDGLVDKLRALVSWIRRQFNHSNSRHSNRHLTNPHDSKGCSYTPFHDRAWSRGKSSISQATLVGQSCWLKIAIQSHGKWLNLSYGFHCPMLPPKPFCPTTLRFNLKVVGQFALNL